MHARIPKNFPTWADMVSAVGNPAPRELAKWLGVTERTVWNYQRAGQAPRAVMLALFWLTPWGCSAVDTDRENELRGLHGLTKSLQRENAALRVRIARLEATGDFGAANEPVHAPELPPRVPATMLG